MAFTGRGGVRGLGPGGFARRLVSAPGLDLGGPRFQPSRLGAAGRRDAGDAGAGIGVQ